MSDVEKKADRFFLEKLAAMTPKRRAKAMVQFWAAMDRIRKEMVPREVVGSSALTGNRKRGSKIKIREVHSPEIHFSAIDTSAPKRLLVLG